VGVASSHIKAWHTLSKLVNGTQYYKQHWLHWGVWCNAPLEDV